MINIQPSPLRQCQEKLALTLICPELFTEILPTVGASIEGGVVTDDV